jgi:hypothetical protein
MIHILFAIRVSEHAYTMLETSLQDWIRSRIRKSGYEQSYSVASLIASRCRNSFYPHLLTFLAMLLPI